MSQAIADMGKDDLAELALAHGVELDMTKRIDGLRNQVVKLLADKGDAIVAEATVVVKKVKLSASHLKNPVTGHVFVSTQHLIARGDLIPCDEDGTPV